MQNRNYAKKIRRKNYKYSINKDINVTPFVDVMLVLLIIFMVAAPLMKVGVKVNLPTAKSPSLSEKIEPVTISIKNNGDIFLQDSKIMLQTLPSKIKTIMSVKPNTPVFIRGDKSVAYEKIIDIISILNTSGIHKIALLTNLPAKK